MWKVFCEKITFASFILLFLEKDYNAVIENIANYIAQSIPEKGIHVYNSEEIPIDKLREGIKTGRLATMYGEVPRDLSAGLNGDFKPLVMIQNAFDDAMEQELDDDLGLTSRCDDGGRAIQCRRWMG